jgi:hypothetical protein
MELEHGNELKNLFGLFMDKMQDGQKYLEIYGLRWLIMLDTWFRLINQKELSTYLVISSTMKGNGDNEEKRFDLWKNNLLNELYVFNHHIYA